MMRADEELLRRAAAGDSDSFAEFYRRLLPAIVTFARRRVQTPELAFDIAAETFAAVAANIADFDPRRGSARAWVFTIALNEIRKAWRRGQVEDSARRRLAFEPIDLDDDALERIESVVDECTLVQALGELSDAERAAVTARILEERDYPDIARELQCSESVVRQRVSRGLRRLRNLVER